MNRFQFSGLHHVAIATSDLEKTVHFWRDLLGFKIVFGIIDNEQKQIAIRISKQMMVFFFEWREVEPIKPKRHGEPVSGPFHFDHLALNMESRKDLYHLQDQLVCADLPVSDVINHGFLHSIYTFDPNGVPLEFNWVVPDIDLDKQPIFIAEKGTNRLVTDLNPPSRDWPVCKEDPEEDRITLPGKELDYF